MNRRELLKTGLLAAGAISVGLTGCSNQNAQNDTTAFNDVQLTEPKQTKKYEISTPLPFSYKLIDEMVEMNKKYTKAKIVTLYNNIPNPLHSQFNGFFSAQRGENKYIKSYKDFQNYFQYAKQNGFNFVYLLNSPKPLSELDYNIYKDKFYYLLDFLNDIGCENIKIANTQVADLINDYKHEFKLHASTAFEFHNLLQYINLVHNYPNIIAFDLSIDENRNFKIIRNLKSTFPNRNIEIIVNEPCLKGCPSRFTHCSSEFYAFNCWEIIDPINNICKTHKVYPWDLVWYQNSGVNSFKLVSFPKRANFNNLDFIKNYLDCMEYGIRNIDIDFFINSIYFPRIKELKKIKMNKILKYFPDIRYFIKNGDKCASICGIECTYCNKCADKIREIVSYEHV